MKRATERRYGMEQNVTGYYVKRISDYIEADANRELEQYGITCAQVRVLSYLLNRRDRQTIQKDIEDFFALKHPTVIGILQRMEAKGFIKSEVDPRDRRQRLITLTDEAYKLEERIAEHVEYEEKNMAIGLTPDELETLKKLLYKVYKNITAR